MSKRMSKMDIHSIKEMNKEGMSGKDIAYVMECSPSAISRILSGERGTKIDEIADRMEAFLGGATKDSGCSMTTSFENEESEQVIYQADCGQHIDTTFETVAFEESMELFLTELDNSHEE